MKIEDEATVTIFRLIFCSMHFDKSLNFVCQDCCQLKPLSLFLFFLRSFSLWMAITSINCLSFYFIDKIDNTYDYTSHPEPLNSMLKQLGSLSIQLSTVRLY